MESETKEIRKRLRLELLKQIWYITGFTVFLLLTVVTFIRYYWSNEQPTNFTILIILLMAISFSEKRK